jgi:hypothetical protein
MYVNYTRDKSTLAVMIQLIAWSIEFPCNIGSLLRSPTPNMPRVMSILLFISRAGKSL